MLGIFVSRIAFGSFDFLLTPAIGINGGFPVSFSSGNLTLNGSSEPDSVRDLRSFCIRPFSRCMTEKPVILHEMLKALMKRKGVSARTASREMEIPQSTFQGFLDGEREPSVTYIPRLAAYFQCSIDYLLTGNESQVEHLNGLLTEEIFDGFLKVKIERVIQKGAKK